jgi:hypothetical protein
MGKGDAPISFCFSLDCELNRMYMFAGLIASLKVRASAERFSVVKVYNVGSISRLRRYFPTNRSFNYITMLSYLQSSFFSGVHLNSPSTYLYTNSIYYLVLTCQEVWYILLVNIFKDDRWSKTIYKLAKSSYGVIVVVAGTNGLLETKTRVLVYVLNVKAQIGTNLNNQQKLSSDYMSCNVGQYLPTGDTPVAEVERIVHLKMVALLGRLRGRRRHYLPPQEIEFVITTQDGKMLSLSGCYLPEFDECYFNLSQRKTVLREFHKHEGHINPKMRNHPITQLHVHFPTVNFPLPEKYGSYAYSLGEGDFTNVEDCAKYMCAELMIELVEWQPRLRARGQI